MSVLIRVSKGPATLKNVKNHSCGKNVLSERRGEELEKMLSTGAKGKTPSRKGVFGSFQGHPDVRRKARIEEWPAGWRPLGKPSQPTGEGATQILS